MDEMIVLIVVLAVVVIGILGLELKSALKEAKQWKAENVHLYNRNAALHAQVVEMRDLRSPPLFGLEEMKTPEQMRRWNDHKTPADRLKWPDEAGNK